MKKQTDIAIPMAVIVAVMFMAIGYFLLYRSDMTGFNATKPLESQLTPAEYNDWALLDMNNLPSNVEVNQNLLLVNATHPLSESFVADISFYKTTDVPMNTAMHVDYSMLSAAVMDQFSNKLYVESSYRSREHQAEIYEAEGPEIAAVPGTSEHETGLALDVYVMYYAGPGFAKAEEGKFVNSHCSEYGFIIRYPMGAQDITGFEYEPWHIRYVGFPHASLITSSGITLEEYIEYFEVGSYYSCPGYLIGRFPADAVYVPAEYVGAPIMISPDNCGNVFVTVSVE